MKIAVTSRSFSANESLRNKLLEKYKDVSFNTTGERLSGARLYDFLKEADGAIIGLEEMDRDLLQRLPRLKTISKYGVGLNNLDLEYMREKGINLGWSSGANKRSVSELTLSNALSMLRQVPSSRELVKEGAWKQLTGRQLSEKTYGILGLGSIGQDLVKLLSPFNCSIIAFDIADRTEFSKENGVSLVTLEELFERSEVLSIHTPFDSSTNSMVNYALLELMGEESILINTARGGIVNELDLERWLRGRPTTCAAFDVLEIEPPVNNSLLELDNFFLTPHIGGSSREAILAMGEAAIKGLSQFVRIPGGH